MSVPSRLLSLAVLWGLACVSELPRAASPLVATRDDDALRAPPSVSSPREHAAPSFARFTLSNGLTVFVATRADTSLATMAFINRRGGHEHAGPAVAPLLGLVAVSGALGDEGYDAQTLDLDHHAAILAVTLPAWSVSDAAWRLARSLQLRDDHAHAVARAIARFDGAMQSRAASRGWQSLLRGQFFGADDPRAWPVYGPGGPLRPVAVADLRSLVEARYTPGECALVVVGAVDPTTMRATFEDAFRGWNAPPPPPRAPAALPERDVRLAFVDDDRLGSVLRVDLALALPLEHGSNTVAADVLVHLLERPDDHGVAFEVALYEDGDARWIEASATLPRDHEDDLIAFLHRIDRLGASGPAAEEFSTARAEVVLRADGVIGSNERLALALARAVAGNASIEGTLLLPSLARATTADDVRRTAALLRSSRRVLRLRGPAGALPEALRGAGYEVERHDITPTAR